MTLEPAYLEKTDRWFDILIGLGLLVLAGGFAYFGGKGLWAWLQGSTAAPASPLGWGIGVPTAAWLLLVSRRLILGLERDRPLVSNGALLVGAVCAFLLAAIGPFIGFGTVGFVRAVTGSGFMTLLGLSAIALRRARRPTGSDEDRYRPGPMQP